jgi:hypothetical protein
MSWYEITKKYNNVKYKLGGSNLNEGIDCLNMILLFLKDIGKDVDDCLNGNKTFIFKGKTLNINNYLEELESEEELHNAFNEFIKQNFTKVNKMKKGDICRYEFKNMLGTGIYIGKDSLMCNFRDCGVKNIKIKNMKIAEIYRCQIRQHGFM